MQSLQNIVVVASDAALSRSLAFALTVEGYTVELFEDWHSARHLMAGALCVIVDADICRKDADARNALLDPANRMLLLADGMSPPIDHAEARILTKPLIGPDVLATVGLFRTATK